MKTSKSTPFLVVALLVAALSSCKREDPGPLQDDRRTYTLSDFNRLEMGNSFRVNVRQGAAFSVVADGDLRNLDDLDVWASGNTLHAKYRHNRNRQYDTQFTIVMPTLKAADFSGAVHSTIGGFSSGTDDFTLRLSGASHADVDVRATLADIEASGASQADLRGSFNRIEILASGASSVKAFDAPAEEAEVDASGASYIRVAVAKRLKAGASGASTVVYRGNPTVDARPSGGSTVRKE